MTIKYKFNKSSEARDCIIESVELEVMKELKVNFTEKEYKDFIDKNHSSFLYEEAEYDEDIIDRDLKNGTEDFISTETYYVKNDCKLITVFNCSRNSQADSTKFKSSTLLTTTKETKTFTSSQQLKDYINTIQEPIEFIAESSIDDVLMKEWIGEWEYIEIIKEKILISYEEFLKQTNNFDLKSYLSNMMRDEDLDLEIDETATVWMYPDNNVTKTNEIKYGNVMECFIDFGYCKENESYYTPHIYFSFEQTIYPNYENYYIENSLEIYKFNEKQVKSTYGKKTGSPKLNSNWIFKIEE